MVTRRSKTKRFIVAMLILMGSLRSELYAGDDNDATEINPNVKEAVVSSTYHDFGETLINGKMKAPSGFVITGNKSQTLTQMIKLRSDFRPQLRSSKFGARSASH